MNKAKKRRLKPSFKKCNFWKLKLERLAAEKDIYFPLFASVWKIKLESVSFKLVQEPEVGLLLLRRRRNKMAAGVKQDGRGFEAGNEVAAHVADDLVVLAVDV